MSAKRQKERRTREECERGDERRKCEDKLGEELERERKVHEAQERHERRRALEEYVGEQGEGETKQSRETMVVSNRHMTWRRSAWWICIEDGPAPTNGKRPKENVSCSRQSCRRDRWEEMEKE